MMKAKAESMMQSGSWSSSNIGTTSKEVSLLLNLDIKTLSECYSTSFISLIGEEQSKADENLDDNVYLKKEQNEYFEITNYNVIPLIKINNIVYENSINIREFIRFGCQNHFFDCRSFKFLRKFILAALILLTALLILVVIFFCRKVLRKKHNNEVNVRVEEAVKKYLVVERA
jgi:hypothetical protein